MTESHTFDRFVQSRREVNDLGDALSEELLEGRAGYLYLDSFWIECLPDGRFYTQIEKSEYIEAELATIERILWDEWVRFNA